MPRLSSWLTRVAPPAFVLGALLAASTAPPVPPSPAPASAAVTYSAPVPEPLDVIRGFDPPTTPYGPGHLGVDLAVRSSQLIRSAGRGVVSFAGSVAGRGLIVVRHPDGISTEYEPLRPLVVAGAVVQTGTPIGRLAGTDPGCGRSHCLHWGARRGDVYLDPLSLLRALGPIRLLPWPEPRG